MMGLFNSIGAWAETMGKRMQGIHECMICGADIKDEYVLCKKCYARNRPYMSKEWNEWHQ